MTLFYRRPLGPDSLSFETDTWGRELSESFRPPRSSGSPFYRRPLFSSYPHLTEVSTPPENDLRSDVLFLVTPRRLPTTPRDGYPRRVVPPSLGTGDGKRETVESSCTSRGHRAVSTAERGRRRSPSVQLKTLRKEEESSFRTQKSR